MEKGRRDAFQSAHAAHADHVPVGMKAHTDWRIGFTDGMASALSSRFLHYI